jgi:very-short-patch-repair endonuclease
VQVGRKTVNSIADLSEMKSIIDANSGLDFLEGSAYSGFEKTIGIEKVILLNEHYRCHPKIARWFNQAFYGSTLAVMTDISQMQDDLRGISWIDVEGLASRPSNQRSWINTAEITEAVNVIRMCLTNGLSIGVVSPFSAQASAIARAVESEFSAELLAEVDFSAGTAHRFQGDERDIIIFSACVAPGINEHAARWVEKERNLINVAVSRARQRLIVLGTPVIATLKCPTISSLRAFILDVNNDAGKIDHRVDSESESRLLSAMIAGGLSPLAKVDVEGFELDFALMAHGRRIDLEVDGDQHFDASRQQCRQDLLRDRVLRRAGWEVLRFPAWRCFVEPQRVVTEISQHLNNSI